MKKLTKTSLLLAIFIFIYILPTKVYASQLNGGQFGWSWNGSTSAGWYQDPAGQNLPKSFYLSGNSSSSNYILNIYSGNYDFNEYTYFYLDTCSNFGQYNFYADISNSSYGNSYFQSGSYRPIYDYGACNMGNTNLTHHLVIEIPVGRYYYSDSFYTADSYLKFRTTTSYGSNVQINYAFVSNEKLSESANMQTTLNSINTAMSTLNTNISNQAQNIINNQNANASQAHTDAQNTQNKIDGVKDAVKDDNVNSNTGKSFFDNFSDNTHGLSGIITAPLNMINGLVNVSSTNCSDLTGTYQNQNFSIPCGKLLWGHTGISQFNDFYNLVVGGALCYWIIRDLFLTIEALKDPDNDKVEVMSL